MLNRPTANKDDPSTKKGPPVNQKGSKMRVSSSIPFGPSTRKITRREYSPCQPKTAEDQVNSDYPVPVQHEEQ
ncbi:hypothetical protein TNIN_313781 [Trichonephila inaurata madagascariensis]|uniref:Uncharacterized protein n=1 Tax=Trichonephila inaurata madagascariensis TaxID=2747483 RepID=A0A8X6XJ48_9ARAC|nr:hypothetical protein TNIN_313781 [Trichonephila inaurata madagascariensis]